VTATLQVGSGADSVIVTAPRLQGDAEAINVERMSSGKRIRKGAVTKCGNAHLRRIVVESAWCYRHLPRVGEKLRRRDEGIPADILEIAWKAQNRLHKRYRKLTMAGKDLRQVMTAVARELLGFIWAIAIKVEQTRTSQSAA
jgi:transposase